MGRPPEAIKEKKPKSTNAPGGYKRKKAKEHNVAPGGYKRKKAKEHKPERGRKVCPAAPMTVLGMAVWGSSKAGTVSAICIDAVGGGSAICINMCWGVSPQFAFHHLY
jgi:hypothetical protein